MPAVTNPTAGTRIEPMDNYKFVRGTTATFKVTFVSEDQPVTVDTATSPTALILEPLFLNKGSSIPTVIATLVGSLVPGQEFEYQFTWDIPVGMVPLDEYVVVYKGTLGGVTYTFADEYFTILANAGQINARFPTYATIADVRMTKANIDDYTPPVMRDNLISRNNFIEFHLRNSTTKLREELGLHKQRSNSENYRLFCIYHTIYAILLSARGEDGSSVSDQNIQFWKQEWQAVLAQEKRQSVVQGIPLGRG